MTDSVIDRSSSSVVRYPSLVATDRTIVKGIKVHKHDLLKNYCERKSSSTTKIVLIDIISPRPFHQVSGTTSDSMPAS